MLCSWEPQMPWPKMSLLSLPQPQSSGPPVARPRHQPKLLFPEWTADIFWPSKRNRFQKCNFLSTVLPRWYALCHAWSHQKSQVFNRSLPPTLISPRLTHVTKELVILDDDDPLLLGHTVALVFPIVRSMLRHRPHAGTHSPASL